MNIDCRSAATKAVNEQVLHLALHTNSSWWQHAVIGKLLHVFLSKAAPPYKFASIFCGHLTLRSDTQVAP